MKKLTILFAVLLSALFSASAEEGDLAAFKSMAADSRITVYYSFSGSSPKGKFAGKGSVTYQDGAYLFISDGLKVYDDTKTRWTVNEVSKEVIAEPSTALGSFKDATSLLKLFGVNAKGASISVLKGKDGKPEGIKCQLKDGTEVNVTFPSVKLAGKGPMNDFSFDSSLLNSSWVFTDLR